MTLSTKHQPNWKSELLSFLFCVCLVGGWQHLFFSFWYEWQVEKRREPFSSIVALPPFAQPAASAPTNPTKRGREQWRNNDGRC